MDHYSQSDGAKGSRRDIPTTISPSPGFFSTPATFSFSLTRSCPLPSACLQSPAELFSPPRFSNPPTSSFPSVTVSTSTSSIRQYLHSGPKHTEVPLLSPAWSLSVAVHSLGVKSKEHPMLPMRPNWTSSGLLS